jgi:hypothetical protein
MHVTILGRSGWFVGSPVVSFSFLLVVCLSDDDAKVLHTHVQNTLQNRKFGVRFLAKKTGGSSSSSSIKRAHLLPLSRQKTGNVTVVESNTYITFFYL